MAAGARPRPSQSPGRSGRPKCRAQVCQHTHACVTTACAPPGPSRVHIWLSSAAAVRALQPNTLPTGNENDPPRGARPPDPVYPHRPVLGRAGPRLDSASGQLWALVRPWGSPALVLSPMATVTLARRGLQGPQEALRAWAPCAGHGGHVCPLSVPVSAPRAPDRAGGLCEAVLCCGVSSLLHHALPMWGGGQAPLTSARPGEPQASRPLQPPSRWSGWGRPGRSVAGTGVGWGELSPA